MYPICRRLKPQKRKRGKDHHARQLQRRGGPPMMTCIRQQVRDQGKGECGLQVPSTVDVCSHRCQANARDDLEPCTVPISCCKGDIIYGTPTIRFIGAVLQVTVHCSSLKGNDPAAITDAARGPHSTISFDSARMPANTGFYLVINHGPQRICTHRLTVS